MYLLYVAVPGSLRSHMLDALLLLCCRHSLSSRASAILIISRTIVCCVAHAGSQFDSSPRRDAGRVVIARTPKAYVCFLAHLETGTKGCLPRIESALKSVYAPRNASLRRTFRELRPSVNCTYICTYIKGLNCWVAARKRLQYEAIRGLDSSHVVSVNSSGLSSCAECSGSKSPGLSVRCSFCRSRQPHLHLHGAAGGQDRQSVGKIGWLTRWPGRTLVVHGDPITHLQTKLAKLARACSGSACDRDSTLCVLGSAAPARLTASGNTLPPDNAAAYALTMDPPIGPPVRLNPSASASSSRQHGNTPLALCSSRRSDFDRNNADPQHPSHSVYFRPPQHPSGPPHNAAGPLTFNRPAQPTSNSSNDLSGLSHRASEHPQQQQTPARPPNMMAQEHFLPPTSQYGSTGPWVDSNFQSSSSLMPHHLLYCPAQTEGENDKGDSRSASRHAPPGAGNNWSPDSITSIPHRNSFPSSITPVPVGAPTAVLGKRPTFDSPIISTARSPSSPVLGESVSHHSSHANADDTSKKPNMTSTYSSRGPAPHTHLKKQQACLTCKRRKVSAITP